MKAILIWLGLADSPASFENEKRPVRFKSTYPENQPDLNSWLKEFKVSIMHGKAIVHI